MTTAYTFKSNSPNHLVQLLQLADLNEQQLSSWNQLAQSALSPNPFCEPQFVLPLVRSLNIAGVHVLVVMDEEENWLFAAPVVQHYFEQGLPLPKLRALRSNYTFLDQPLVSRSNPPFVMLCLLDALAAQRDWHGLGFAKMVLETEQQQLFDFVAASTSIQQQYLGEASRPCTVPQSEDDLLTNCSGSRRKTLRKGWKRLNKLGEVRYQLVSDKDANPAAIDAFLKVEESGWKGKEETALNKLPADKEFFVTMCHEFGKQGRCLFGEIVLNDEVIASTCNLLAGDTLFAFKIGWDQQFADCSLGYWSEILLADAVSREFPNIQLIDSCSDEDSYTGKVWQDRLKLSHCRLIWSYRARVYNEAKSYAKALLPTR